MGKNKCEMIMEFGRGAYGSFQEMMVMGKRELPKKQKLAKAARQIKRIPAFVQMRTKNAVAFNRRRRSWRTDKLRIEE